MLLVSDSNNTHIGEEILVSGGGDGTIRLWTLDQSNGASITLLKTLENGDESVLSLSIDGTLLYSGRLGGDINVWDLDTYQLVRRVPAHTSDVLTLAVDYHSIFSGSADGVVKVR